jgi:hypothetical protein
MKLGEEAQYVLAGEGRGAIRVHVAVHLVGRRLARDKLHVTLLVVVHPVRHAIELMLAAQLASRFTLGTH